MTDRERALHKIAVGDIFHAEGQTGSSRTCITIVVRDTSIVARDISIQVIYEFDRHSGVAVRFFGTTPYRYTIDSVAPLPDDIRDIVRGLDEKCREGEYRRAEDPQWERPAGELALTEDQIRAYLFCADFYRANPI